MGLSKLIQQKQQQKRKQEKIKIAKAATFTAAIGTTVGAIGGLLFAPKSGKETRCDLKDVTQKANDEIKNKAGQAKEVINSKLDDRKENFKEAKSKISSYLADKKADKTTDEIIEENEVLIEDDNELEALNIEE